MTDHGVLDVMQWVPGIEAENVYAGLASDAIAGEVFGVTVHICSRESLLAMKRAAGRPIDQADLEALG